MVKQLLNTYRENPNIYFIFLGRDSDYLYDALKTITHNTPLDKRVFLLPFSGDLQDKMSPSSQKTIDFLKQFIDFDALISGEKSYQIIDTGFLGSRIKWMNKVICEYE